MAHHDGNSEVLNNFDRKFIFASQSYFAWVSEYLNPRSDHKQAQLKLGHDMKWTHADQ